MFVVTVLIGMGMGLTLLAEPRFAKLLSITGAPYVFWLGIQFLRAAKTASGGAAVAGNGGTGIGFVDGAVILMFDPKAYYVIGLLFTQFLQSENGRLFQVLGITAIFTLNTLLAFAAWTLAGAALARIFGEGRSGRGINIFFAVCLMGVAIWMIMPVLRLL